MSPRPPVSVIVPFRGSQQGLEATLTRLDRLVLGNEDEVLIADNRAGAGAVDLPGAARIVPAPGLRSPAHARNLAAAEARGEWLVLIDADVTPAPDLIDAYFAEPPPPDVGILVGSIEGVADPDTVVSRYATERGFIGQERNLVHPYMPWGQTANLAVRQDVFGQVGGFTDGIRAAEDADLCFRVQRAGFRLEGRPAARASHHHRHTVSGLLTQQLVHAAGLAWLDRTHPGASPAMGPVELVRRSGHYALEAARAGEAEERRFALLDLAVTLAFELGRARTNRARPT